MKKITALLLLAWMCVSVVNAQAVLEGKTYTVDTIMQRQIGPGVVQTIVRLPEFPMNAYILETDLTSEYNRVETTQAKNQLGKTETLANAYIRHKSMGKKPLAACNASFWCVSSQTPWYDFMPGVPHGAEVVNDTIYVNTNRNGVYDFNGGSVNTASTIITKDGKALVGRHEWYGCVKSPKFSTDQEIIQVNKCCDYNQLVLFNHARGRNSTFFTYPTGCTYVFLKLKEDSKWTIAKDIKFEVAKIELEADNQVLGDYDACLIADGTAYKAEMAKLAVGDEVAINTYWFDIDGDKTPIEVENMTEGEAHVMLKGEITDRANGSYGAMVYSRTAYGCNADGTKLYMIVIDKSTHPEYGTSAGCTATVMCQLWKSLVPDLWNVANMDAGGSAQMLVDGSVINYTTEGTPRAVANGMMLFSTAPEVDNDVITTLRFDKPHHKVPVYYSYKPKVLGYNKYGELIAEDVDVTYTCSENIGTPSGDGKVIEVGANPCLGTITAHYNGVEVTAAVYVESQEFSIRLKPMILLDNKREYTMEITTELNGETFEYDPSRFDWTSSDENVAIVENGVVKGLAEGTTTLTATLGDFTDETTVKVEIASSPKLYQAWTGWEVATSRVTDAVLAEDGTLSFNYTGQKRAYISLNKDVVFYSIPERLWLEFTTTTPIQTIDLDLRSNLEQDEENILTYKNTGGYSAGETHKVEIRLSELGDTTDVGIYPLHLKSMKFTPYTVGYVSGANTLSIKGLYAEYGNSSSGVETVAVSSSIKVYPNPVIDGRFTVSAVGVDAVNVAIFNMSGSMIYNRDIEINGGSAVVEPKLTGGMYLVKVTENGNSQVCKMIVK